MVSTLCSCYFPIFQSQRHVTYGMDATILCSYIILYVVVTFCRQAMDGEKKKKTG